MPDWKLKNIDNAPDELIEKFGKVTAMILASRGITSCAEAQAFFSPEYEKDVHDPFLFRQMPIVMARLKEAVEKKEKVVVYGDYDADGVTASVILKETLEKIGLDCGVYIPDKKGEGYGLNEGALEKLAKENISLILTVDCGITNIEEVAVAKKLGLDVIIIDHHHVPEKFPEAVAIINPKMEGCGYPFLYLAGVGVTMKVVQAIYQEFLASDTEQSKWLLDLVAIGTIADSVPLVGENRTIVKFGQVVLAKTRRIGLQEIFSVGRIRIDEDNFPDERKIAFQISPRINAAGRMDHANAAFNLLVEKDRVIARTLALDLEASNQRRQKETERIFQEIKEVAGRDFKQKKMIFAASEHYPIGIAGLVAGKITDEFGKPCVVLQKEAEISRGSLRSVPGINIIETLEECSELLEKFGGHDQAAGITIKNDNLEKFSRKIENIMSQKMKNFSGEKIMEADIDIEAREIDYDLVRNIERLHPFGEGNRQPALIIRNMLIKEIKKVGSQGKHAKIFLKPDDDTPKIFEAIWFNSEDKLIFGINANVDILANLQLDKWNGNEKIVLNVIDMRETSENLPGA